MLYNICVRIHNIISISYEIEAILDRTLFPTLMTFFEWFSIFLFASKECSFYFCLDYNFSKKRHVYFEPKPKVCAELYFQ